MVELKFSGMCEGCLCARIDVDYLKYENGERLWMVKCECEGACYRAYQMGEDFANENQPIRSNY